MTPTAEPAPATPPLVSILRQGDNLIASIHTALDDTELQRFQRDLIERVGRDRARGIVIDVSALDVLDSFASHVLSGIASTARLRGATTIVVGINPEVAFAMVQLGTRLANVVTALDLDEGLVLLNGRTTTRRTQPGDKTPGARYPG